jgi:hypothetical protein
MINLKSEIRDVLNLLTSVVKIQQGAKRPERLWRQLIAVKPIGGITSR